MSEGLAKILYRASLLVGRVSMDLEGNTSLGMRQKLGPDQRGYHRLKGLESHGIILMPYIFEDLDWHI